VKILLELSHHVLEALPVGIASLSHHVVLTVTSAVPLVRVVRDVDIILCVGGDQHIED